jgi:hypothetical protein
MSASKKELLSPEQQETAKKQKKIRRETKRDIVERDDTPILVDGDKELL